MASVKLEGDENYRLGLIGGPLEDRVNTSYNASASASSYRRVDLVLLPARFRLVEMRHYPTRPLPRKGLTSGEKPGGV